MRSLRITPISENWFKAEMTLGKKVVFFGRTWGEVYEKAWTYINARACEIYKESRELRRR